MQCNFHPSEDAIANCDRCNRPVCGRKKCLQKLLIFEDPIYNEHTKTEFEYLTEGEKDFHDSKDYLENPSNQEMYETDNYCFLCLFQIKHNQYSEYNISNLQIGINTIYNLPIPLILLSTLYLIYTNFIIDQFNFIITLFFLFSPFFLLFGIIRSQIKDRNEFVPRLERLEQDYYEFFNVTYSGNLNIKCVRCHTPIKAEESICPNLECDIYENGIKKEETSLENIPSVADVNSSIFGGKSQIKKDFFNPEKSD